MKRPSPRGVPARRRPISFRIYLDEDQDADLVEALRRCGPRGRSDFIRRLWYFYLGATRRGGSAAPAGPPHAPSEPMADELDQLFDPGNPLGF